MRQLYGGPQWVWTLQISIIKVIIFTEQTSYCENTLDSPNWLSNKNQIYLGRGGGQGVTAFASTLVLKSTSHCVKLLQKFENKWKRGQKWPI